MRTFCFPLLLGFLLCGCANEDKKPISPTAILISNVTVIDVTDGSLQENRQVVIDSGTILKVVSDIPDSADYQTRIDGKGKFLIPGLAEMHAHIPSPPTSRERVEETLFLYLSNGITTIRGMLGHPSHLELRDDALEGNLLSPRILTSSPSLNGNTVPNPAVADSLVRTYAEDGYDFLKIHPGIEREPFDGLIAAANEAGIPFSGHVPVAVGIRHALESEYASIDHIDGFLEGLVPESKMADPASGGFFGYNFTPLADTTLIEELVTMSKQHGVWIVPTQSLFERWFAPADTDSLLQQPEMKYMPASTLAEWKRIKLESTGPESEFDKSQWEQFIRIRRQLLKELQENGQGILLGSDAPQLFNVPGFSIHHEIDGMERAGLSPLEILQSGTVNPARFFGMEDSFGKIREGMAADLILLQHNPLNDLSALKEIEGVMVRGRWLNKADIDSKLEEIAGHAANQ